MLETQSKTKNILEEVLFMNCFKKSPFAFETTTNKKRKMKWLMFFFLCRIPKSSSLRFIRQRPFSRFPPHSRCHQGYQLTLLLLCLPFNNLDLFSLMKINKSLSYHNELSFKLHLLYFVYTQKQLKLTQFRLIL
jgi:hypothetical protein